jgi:hypothetical protein
LLVKKCQWLRRVFPEWYQPQIPEGEGTVFLKNNGIIGYCILLSPFLVFTLTQQIQQG